jgi:hypothetical protein
MDTISQNIDNLIKERAEIIGRLLKIGNQLNNEGVKFGNLDGDNPIFQVGLNYLPQFANTLEEFEWEAKYNDGTYLRQYDLNGQHHFGDIDMSKLVSIKYVSNFNGENDNEDRRVILTLDFLNGNFELKNGKIDIDERNKLSMLKDISSKKLILFKRHRFGQMMEMGEKITPTDEIYMYNRYYLGYENDNQKVIVCLYPNGQAKIE